MTTTPRTTRIARRARRAELRRVCRKSRCHRGNKARIVLELIQAGPGMFFTGVRCPRCGFRTFTIHEGEDNEDVTDRYVLATRQSTLLAWDAEGRRR